MKQSFRGKMSVTKCWWQYFTIPTQSVRLEQENKAYVKNEQFENRTHIHTLNTVHGCYSDNSRTSVL